MGKLKDEENGKIIKGFIGLKPKMYAIKLENDDLHKKAKGIPKRKVKKELSFNDYKSVLDNANREKIKFTSIRSEKTCHAYNKPREDRTEQL